MVGSPSAFDRLEPVSAQALVLRGGVLSVQSLDKNARNVHENYGVWGICVTAGEATSPAALALSGARFKNAQMSVAAAADINSNSRRVVLEPGHKPPASLIVFDHKPTGDDWSELQEIFARRNREPNPVV